MERSSLPLNQDSSLGELTIKFCTLRSGAFFIDRNISPQNSILGIFITFFRYCFLLQGILITFFRFLSLRGILITFFRYGQFSLTFFATGKSHYVFFSAGKSHYLFSILFSLLGSLITFLSLLFSLRGIIITFFATFFATENSDYLLFATWKSHYLFSLLFLATISFLLKFFQGSRKLGGGGRFSTEFSVDALTMCCLLYLQFWFTTVIITHLLL